MATVPTGLQTGAKVLQMHLSRGRGTPWMQPKSNVTFKLAPLDELNTLGAVFGLKPLHYSGHCAHRIANRCKSVANTDFRGWGDTLVATHK